MATSLASSQRTVPLLTAGSISHVEAWSSSRSAPYPPSALQKVLAAAQARAGPAEGGACDAIAVVAVGGANIRFRSGTVDGGECGFSPMEACDLPSHEPATHELLAELGDPVQSWIRRPCRAQGLRHGGNEEEEVDAWDPLVNETTNQRGKRN